MARINVRISATLSRTDISDDELSLMLQFLEEHVQKFNDCFYASADVVSIEDGINEYARKCIQENKAKEVA